MKTERKLIGWANAEAALCAAVATWVWKMHRDVRATSVTDRPYGPELQEASLRELGWCDLGKGDLTPTFSLPIADPQGPLEFIQPFLKMDPRCWWACLWIARRALRTARADIRKALLKRTKKPHWSEQLSRNPNGRKPGNKVAAPGTIRGRQ